MIITRLIGGLGNQMFQYAAGLALAEHRRTVLKLDVSAYGEVPGEPLHARYGLNCFNVVEQFATETEVNSVRGADLRQRERLLAAPLEKSARALGLSNFAKGFRVSGRRHTPTTFGFYPAFFDLPDHTYLEGMFQSEQFFQRIGGLVRLHFTFRYPPLPAVAEMMTRIQQSRPSAAIHFRRGDYVSGGLYTRQNGALSLDYYHEATRLLRSRFPDLTLFVFSDDIDAVEREFRPDCPVVFVRATEPWHAFDKIRLMSLCDHAVIANSTFSWWGAWLNPSPTKVVIGPTPWFADCEHYDGDIVPVTWTQLPRSTSVL